MWTVNGRGAYATEEDARAADTGGAAPAPLVDDSDFASSFGDTPRVLRPAGTAATATSSPTIARERQTEFEAANALYAQGYQDLNNDGKITEADKSLSGVAYGTPTSEGGTANGYQVTQVNLGNRDAKPVNGHPTRQTYRVKGIEGEGADGFTSAFSYHNTPGGTGTRVTGHVTPPGSAAGRGPTGFVEPEIRDLRAREDTQQAESRALDKIEENDTENNNLFSDALDRFDDLGGGEYGLSDEARGYQQEGLQQQRMLLEKLLGFDESQYAAQFGDEALARTIAAGRQGTSAAQQQAGMFAAMEQAPALYAEGQRQAASLANQRLGMAEDAAKAFGELGTMTRGQDETRAQFEAQLPLEIATKVSELSQGKMSLNQQDSKMFADMWMDFAQLQSVYAGMSSAEQIAWWREESARRGQDKALEGIMAQIKANGAVTDKDLINGLFQLGGGILGLAGRQGAS